MSEVNQTVRATLGELADEPVEQSGPTGDFVYIDISSIDRATKRIVDPKFLTQSQAPSRAKQVLKAGDVLVSMTRPNLNAVALVPDQLDGSIASTGFHVLRSRWLNPGFLFALVQTQSFVDAMSAAVQGALYPAVRPRDIAAYPFSYESPAQQARIVARLEELLSDLDAGVAELQAAQKKLAQYRQSILKAAVEGTLTTEWRTKHTPTETGSQLLTRVLAERRARWETKQLSKFKAQGKTPPKEWRKKYPEPVKPDIIDLPELPAGWAWASVDQCSMDESSITDGPFGSNLKSSHYQDNGPRVIRLQNIGDGVFLDAQAHISELHYSRLLKHTVQEDDVVIAMLGEVLPRACIIPAGVAPAIVKADCARVRANKDLIVPTILSAQLNSKPVRDVVAKFVKGIGRPRVNLSHIRAIPIALCSMEEQLQMEILLSAGQQSVERQNEAIDFALKQCTAQRENILRAAFAGQLVPQELDNEPASLLLERIRAELAERAKQPKVRKPQQQKEIAAVVRKLIEVLAEAGDWVPAQEAFQRCGVADGAETDDVEALYAELRDLDKAGRLAVEAVTDTQGRKLHDRLKLLPN